MHKEDDVVRALALHRLGVNQSEIARRLSIPRGTVRYWLKGFVPDFDGRIDHQLCDYICRDPATANSASYTYLLGLYLGDGYVSRNKYGVYRLRIACDDKYPYLMTRCEAAIKAAMPENATGRVQSQGCSQVYGYSKHWPCLFPQHGLGRKHDREIRLEPWQQEMVDLDPRPLIEGLIHSDGCRVTNFAINARTKKRYEYPRYQFSNVSTDIHQIFTDALDQLDIPWKKMNRVNTSINKREAVAMMDSFIAPKC